MKRIVLLTFFVMVSFLLVKPQNYVPSLEDVQAFLKTKTLVVLDDNPMGLYNKWIKEAVEKNWKITEYDFISYKEFDKFKNDPSYSFLMTTDVNFEKDKLRARYKFLNLVLGGNYRRLADMPDLCPIPMGYLNADEENYIFKLGVFVRFIQNHIHLLQQEPKISSKNVFRHYNDNKRAEVKNKTLYLQKDELAPDVNTKEKIARVYPYNVEIVDREQIERAIRNRDEEIVFLHKVGPEGTRLNARCYKVLIGAGDASFYFFDHHMIKLPKRPDGILARDFKRLSK